MAFPVRTEILQIFLGAIAGLFCAVITTNVVSSSINDLDENEMRMVAIAEHIRSAIENDVTEFVSSADCALALHSGSAEHEGASKQHEFHCSSIVDGREFFTLTGVSEKGFEYGTWDWGDE